MSRNIDDRIREALQAEDAELFDEFGGEQSLHEMVLDGFRGKRLWLNMLAIVFSFVFVALGVYCAIQFFSVDEVRVQLFWSAGMACSVLTVALLKLWFWMEMQRSAITREVKRVELQIARLAKRIEELAAERRP